ncbi:MAG: phosphopyruvate hydratase [Ruminococcaceae bacterium]|nr:phosphopyruvate hydratase [Oscillospiraceae bacterium]
MNKPQIMKCCAREILDSRGNPTVETSVFLTDGTVGVAAVPSGASTGIYEAHEKRDGDPSRFGGKGVREAVFSVCRTISPAIAGVSASEQKELDDLLIKLDGKENKSSLGANAILSVSLAAARAAANFYHVPLYKYLGGLDAFRLPMPMINIINGGAHASNSLDIQEFMIVPVGFASFSEALRAGAEIYSVLGKLLRSKGYGTTVGDEGGYAPDLGSDREAIELICDAISKAGYSEASVKIALDVAASEWYTEERGYFLPKAEKSMTLDGLTEHFGALVRDYPIISIEDPLDQRDFSGWSRLTEKLGDKIMLVGDDLFVTNEKRLKKGIAEKAANAILIKPNQIGTLSETLEVIRVAKEAGYDFIISHRSGETEDTTIADIAVALGSRFIKSGAPCRSERVAKYNRLLRIESSLNSSARYGYLDLSTTKKI